MMGFKAHKIANLTTTSGCIYVWRAACRLQMTAPAMTRGTGVDMQLATVLLAKTINEAG